MAANRFARVSHLKYKGRLKRAVIKSLRFTSLSDDLFMLNPSRKLAELVRILEEGGYIFAGDPVQATEALRHVEGGAEGKIIRRAEMIDRDSQLRHTLEQVRTGSFWLWIVAAAAMFSTGFSGTYLLMDSQGLNFFLILAGVLRRGFGVKTPSIRRCSGCMQTNGGSLRRVGSPARLHTACGFAP